MRHIQSNGFEMIHKSLARKMFDLGLTVAVSTSNTVPMSKVDKHSEWLSQNQTNIFTTFDMLVEDFVEKECDYYTGMYPVFWAETQEKGLDIRFDNRDDPIRVYGSTRELYEILDELSLTNDLYLENKEINPVMYCYTAVELIDGLMDNKKSYSEVCSETV